MRGRMVVVLTAVMVMGFSLSYARMGEKSMEGKERWHRMTEELNLTEEQKDEIREQKNKNVKKRIKIQNELKLKFHDLKVELQEKEIDTKKVNKLTEEVSLLKSKIFKNRINSLLEFKKILTDEQWEKIKDLKIKKIEKGMGKREMDCKGQMKK